MATTLFTSGLFTRPTQAVFLNSLVGCMLNIGVCPAPTDPTNPETPNDPVLNPEPGEDDIDPADPEDPTDPGEEPVIDDTTPPTATVAVNPGLAGGNTQTVLITGNVADENLSGYVLSLNGNVVEQVSETTETTIDISVPWSVASPNKVPSGIYTITLDVTDKGNNTFRAETTVIVDNDGPVVKVTGGNVIIKSGSISPSVEATDAQEGITYIWAADEANPGSVDFDSNAKEPVFTPYFEGTYTFYLTATDSLGNATVSEFSFGYARELAILPLPIIENLNNKVTPTTQTPAVTSASSNAIAKDTETKAEVLGSTVVTEGIVPVALPATAISPTTSGWSILGILWYWWLVVIAVIFAGWIGVKKLMLSRPAQHS